MIGDQSLHLCRFIDRWIFVTVTAIAKIDDYAVFLVVTDIYLNFFNDIFHCYNI